MVGGFSFDRSKFNRATQAHRQLGSMFKPIVYTTAIDRGFTPVSMFVDEPVVARARTQPAAVRADELRPQVRRAGDAAPCARAVAQHSRGEGDARGRSAAGGELRGAVRLPRQRSHRICHSRSARRRRRCVDATAAYSRVPEPGRADDAVRRDDDCGSRGQRARAEPAGSARGHSGRYVVRHDEPAARRRAARHRGRGCVTRLAARRQDRARWTITPTRGSSGSIRTSRSVCGSATTRRSRSAAPATARPGATAALPIWMDFMRPTSNCAATASNPPQFEPPGNIVFVTLDSGITEAFINGTQPQGVAASPGVGVNPSQSRLGACALQRDQMRAYACRWRRRTLDSRPAPRWSVTAAWPERRVSTSLG